MRSHPRTAANQAAVRPREGLQQEVKEEDIYQSELNRASARFKSSFLRISILFVNLVEFSAAAITSIYSGRLPDCGVQPGNAAIPPTGPAEDVG